MLSRNHTRGKVKPCNYCSMHVRIGFIHSPRNDRRLFHKWRYSQYTTKRRCSHNGFRHSRTATRAKRNATHATGFHSKVSAIYIAGFEYGWVRTRVVVCVLGSTFCKSVAKVLVRLSDMPCVAGIWTFSQEPSRMWGCKKTPSIMNDALQGNTTLIE